MERILSEIQKQSMDMKLLVDKLYQMERYIKEIEQKVDYSHHSILNQLLTCEDVAKLLRLTKITVRKLYLETGKIKVIPRADGARWRVKVSDYLEFTKSSRKFGDLSEVSEMLRQRNNI